MTKAPSWRGGADVETSEAAAGCSGAHIPKRSSESAQASRPVNWQTSPARNEIYATHWLAALRTGRAAR